MLIEDIAFNAARRGAEEFLRPRTATEKLFLIAIALYLVFAVIIRIIEYRIIFFLLFLIAGIISWLQGYGEESEGRTLFSTSLKIIFTIIIANFFPSVWYDVQIFYPDPFDILNPLTYLNIEMYLTSSLFLISIFLTAIKPELLERGSINGYFNFLTQIVSGYWRMAIALAILIPLLWFPSTFAGIVINYVLILVVAIIFSLVTAIIPRKQVSMLKRRELSLDSVFWAQSNTYSRIRDILVVNLLVLILFTVISSAGLAGNPIFSESTRELIGQIILLMLLGIIIIVVVEPAEKRKSRRTSIVDSFQGVGSNLSGEAADRVSKIKSRIDNLQYEKPEDVYVIPKRDSILKKGNINFKTEQGSVIVPVQETDEGATVVVVGKGDIEVEDASGEKEVKEFEGSTTMLLSPDEWNELKQKMLQKSSFDSLDIRNLPVVMENKEELTNTVYHAVDRIKNWKGPANMLKNWKDPSNLLTKSRYGVLETKDTTAVNFPGIKVLDTKGLTAVNVANFIRVLDSKEGTLVNLPFLKVIDRKDYDYISLPGIQVLDTKHGEIVKVFGMRFGSGDTAELENVINRLSRDEADMKSTFSDKMNNLLSDQGTNFLLAESTDGDVLQITAGETGSLIEEIDANGTVKPRRSIIGEEDEEVFIVGDDGMVEKTEPLEIKSFKAHPESKHSLKREKKDGKIRFSFEAGSKPDKKASRDKRRKIKKLGNQISQLDDALLEGRISEVKHEKMLGRLQAQLKALKDNESE
jgi:hypothetical protein